MAEWIKAPAHLLEDLSLIVSTHTGGLQSYAIPVSWDPMPLMVPHNHL